MVRKVATGTDALSSGLALGEGTLDASGVVVAGESDLSLLRQGKITQAEYVERLVSSATRHLEGAVTAEHLEAIRSVVRAQFTADESTESDPRLGALLRRVTA